MTEPKINKQYIAELTEMIQSLYLEDDIPWVVGYSGGKDSTATLQLVWYSIAELSPKQRKKKRIYVISTDTLVESPVVAAWVRRSLKRMEEAAEEQDMPIEPHLLTPDPYDSFWVNLIGKGYPAPRPGFRWCTQRLKINPSNKFILQIVADHGEAIVVLGTRKAESIARATVMNHYERKRVRERLSPNGNLSNSFVFTPIEDWSNDDVWMYLMAWSNPWGHSNKDLLTMYRGATADGECPLVLDTSTPSCGNSRFGCWVCTVVDEDKSMKAMIQNDQEKVWLSPLLELRNELGQLDDRHRRDFRRLNGSILLYRDRAVHGPYTKEWREYWLKRLLEVQEQVQEIAPPEFKNIELITDTELREIRRIWVIEKHEFDDALPRIYHEVTGQPYPYMNDLMRTPLGPDEWEILRDLCCDDPLFFELQTSLLDIEQRNYGYALRRGILDQLESQILRCFYTSEEDAVERARKKEQDKKDLEKAVEMYSEPLFSS